MIVIGIDPGYTGAIAVFDNDHPIRVYDMPVIKIKNKTELDDLFLKHILVDETLVGKIPIKAQVFIEKAQSMPGQGVVSVARYMTGYGQILGIVTGLGLPKTLVHPRTWKSKMMKDMGKEKGASVLRCKQLYPIFAQYHLTLKKHHGRADAILIAAYGASL